MADHSRLVSFFHWLNVASLTNDKVTTRRGQATCVEARPHMGKGRWSASKEITGLLGSRNTNSRSFGAIGGHRASVVGSTHHFWWHAIHPGPLHLTCRPANTFIGSARATFSPFEGTSVDPLDNPDCGLEKSFSRLLRPCNLVQMTTR